jgi:hypothetical protein
MRVINHPGIGAVIGCIRSISVALGRTRPSAWQRELFQHPGPQGLPRRQPESVPRLSKAVQEASVNIPDDAGPGDPSSQRDITFQR